MFDVDKKLRKAIGVSEYKFHLQPKKRVKKVKRTIVEEDRKTFDNLAVRNYEFGGGIDFNQKGMERIEVQRGEFNNIDLSKDFEVMYHTHPPGSLPIPSASDIHILMRSKKQQAEIVFSPQISVTMVKTRKAREWYQRYKNQLSSMYERFFVGGQSQGTILRNTVWFMTKEMGLTVYVTRAGQKIHIKNLKVRE
jgi:hypothetical protein